MSLSKKKRFEVFKRDGFVCQYCGSTPPKVTLEVDHIQPKSKKGTDDINNLITSCFDCNRGKSNIELSSIPPTLKDNSKAIIEQENQYKEYQKILRSVNGRKQREVNKITKVYSEYYPKYTFNDHFKKNSVEKFISLLGYESVLDAAHIAFNRIDDSHKSIKYFCGICWTRIKEL